MVTPVALKRAVAWLLERQGVSVRRARRCLGLAESTYRYERRPTERRGLRARLKALAAERPRFGYRRLHVLLRREGWVVNHKLVQRLYREEGLAVRRKKRKRVARGRRKKRSVPKRMNKRWSMDFMSDSLATGRQIRLLNVVDDWSRECLAMEVDTSLSGARVTRVLDRLIAARGRPESIVLDNGPEFTGEALDRWAYEAGVTLSFIQPGKPVENCFVESFNGKVLDECLNQHWFTDLKDARRKIETWRVDFNRVRPHSSLEDVPPAEYAREALRSKTTSAPQGLLTAGLNLTL